MENNYGYDNELEIIGALNGKKLFMLNSFLRYCINFMFDNPGMFTTIKAYKYEFVAKPDIVIEVKGIKKFVSVKFATSESIHFEGVKTFVLFLRDLGISEETQKTILKFQYGDGTMTGTGSKRQSFEELMISMRDQLDEANKELNRREIIEKTFDRFIVDGGYGNHDSVNYVLIGTKDHGNLVSIEELKHYAIRKDTSYFKTLHIGPITLRPYMRDVGFKSKNQYKRDIIHGDYSGLSQDAMKIESYRKTGFLKRRG